jgi:hypothetical protein
VGLLGPGNARAFLIPPTSSKPIPGGRSGRTGEKRKPGALARQLWLGCEKLGPEAPRPPQSSAAEVSFFGEPSADSDFSGFGEESAESGLSFSGFFPLVA